MAANTRRTGQNDKQFQLQTTPGAGRRTQPQRNRANSPKEGDVTTKEGNKFIFNNGAWRLAPKAPKLPSPAEAAKAKPEVKGPKNGDTTIKEGHKFVFKDGKWLKATASTPKLAAKPSQAPSTSRSSSPAPARSSGSSSSTSKPSPKPVPKPAASGERRVSAATANREAGNYGTSRTDNKMIDDWMREKMRQREGRDLTSKGSDYGSKAMSKQFASSGASAKTDYSPKTKVDGSKYSGKQPSNQTKTAYNSGTNLKPASPASPASPTKTNDKPNVGYESKTKVDGSKYNKKSTNNTQLAFKSKGAESLAEMMRKRRQGMS